MKHKLAKGFANSIRSWPFFFLFVVWTVIWWGFAGQHVGDYRPWILWGAITTLITEIDLIVYGIYQRYQNHQDELMQRSQLDTMKLLVAMSEQLAAQQDEQSVDLDHLSHIKDIRSDSGKIRHEIRGLFSVLQMDEVSKDTRGKIVQEILHLLDELRDLEGE